MDFNPGLRIGQIINNRELVEIFKCGIMGGMRRSKATNTLVIVTDHTKKLYKDKWKDGVLYYTGMGKVGDQDLYWGQDATLANYSKNGVDVHLFEVMNSGEYTYCGLVELVGKPYADTQTDEDERERKVWIFPIRPISYNNFIKTGKCTHKVINITDKINKHEYGVMEAEGNNGYAKFIYNNTINSELEVESKSQVKIFDKCIGRQINHKRFGIGTIKEVEKSNIVVEFEGKGKKKLSYELCLIKGLIEFI